jgi:O-antigen ligase
MVILAINLTRIYIIALGVGIIATFKKIYWKNWLACSFTAFLIFFVSFISINLLLSHGKSYGLELLGLRIHSITRPSIEDSSLSRLLLLPKIEEKIKNHPFLGNGLGASLVVYSPVFKKEITTPHFDWGYLEIIAEMGIVGILIWIFNIGYVILDISRSVDLSKQSYLALLIALLIINTTSPALFHVLGITYLMFMLAMTQQKNNYDTKIC